MPGLIAFGLGLTMWASSARADIYWSNSGSNTIGRASLTGANANQSFITGTGTPWQVAVNGDRIFWGELDRVNRPRQPERLQRQPELRRHGNQL